MAVCNICNDEGHEGIFPIKSTWESHYKVLGDDAQVPIKSSSKKWAAAHMHHRIIKSSSKKRLDSHAAQLTHEL